MFSEPSRSTLEQGTKPTKLLGVFYRVVLLQVSIVSFDSLSLYL